jgi:hypothetical protein
VTQQVATSDGIAGKPDILKAAQSGDCALGILGTQVFLCSGIA